MNKKVLIPKKISLQSAVNKQITGILISNKCIKKPAINVAGF